MVSLKTGQCRTAKKATIICYAKGEEFKFEFLVTNQKPEYHLSY